VKSFSYDHGSCDHRSYGYVQRSADVRGLSPAKAGKNGKAHQNGRWVNGNNGKLALLLTILAPVVLHAQITPPA
jgi:hypothetical protein